MRHAGVVASPAPRGAPCRPAPRLGVPLAVLKDSCTVVRSKREADLRFVPHGAKPRNVLGDKAELLRLPIGRLYGRLIWSREG